MAGVVVELGAQNGLIVPLVAVHMFVFYFGIMADVTPPVGLASFAAAAISKGDPLKTGFQAFFYSIRTALLPFLFIFNTDRVCTRTGGLSANIEDMRALFQQPAAMGNRGVGGGELPAIGKAVGGDIHNSHNHRLTGLDMGEKLVGAVHRRHNSMTLLTCRRRRLWPTAFAVINRNSSNIPKDQVL